MAVALGAGNCGVGLCQWLLDVFGLLSVCSPAVCVCLSSFREDPGDIGCSSAQPDHRSIAQGLAAG